MRLTGALPADRVAVDNGYFTDPADLTRAAEGFAMVREITLRPIRGRLTAAMTPSHRPELRLEPQPPLTLNVDLRFGQPA